MKIFDSETYFLDLPEPFQKQSVQTDSIWLDSYGESKIFINKDHFLINDSVRIYDNNIKPNGSNKEFDFENIFYFRSCSNYQSFLFNSMKFSVLSKLQGEFVVIVQELNKYKKNFIKDLGVNPDCILEPRDTYKIKCKNLFSISDMLVAPNSYHSGVLSFYDDIYDFSEIEQNKKIYVSRSDAVRRRVNGEHKLIKLLKEYGYETVVLEGLEIKEQAEIFAGASHIVAPHGSGLANLVWARSGTKLIELFDSSYVLPTYGALAVRKNIKYLPIVFSTPAFDIPGEFELPVEMAVSMNINVNLELLKQILDSF